jgi:multiple sugar transport system substrate-binding protein
MKAKGLSQLKVVYIVLTVLSLALPLNVFAADKVTVRFWAHFNEAFNDSYLALFEKYQKAYPNVEITLEHFDYDTYIQTLQTAFPAGEEADIMQMFGTWVKSYSGRLSPVPADILTIEDANAKILAATLGGYIIDGGFYGIPQEYNVEYGAVLMNTAMAKEAGIDDITKGWANWDELIADMKKMVKLEDGAMMRAGMNFLSADGIAYTFLSLLKQYGGTVKDENGNFAFNTEAGKKALTLMKKVIDEGVVDPTLYHEDANWTGDSVFEETAASAVIGPWVIADYKDDFPDIVENLAYVPLPGVSEKPEFIAASGWGLVVSKNSKIQEVAWDIVKFITLDPQNAVEWNVGSGTLPALKENTAGENVNALLERFPYMGEHLKLIEYGSYQGHMNDSDQVVYDILYNNILNMLQGNATIEETAKIIQEKAQETEQ